jgi:hypothetical protein
MGITQVEFTASDKEEIVEAEDEEIAEEEGLFHPPQPMYQIKSQIHHSFLYLFQKDQENSGA